MALYSLEYLLGLGHSKKLFILWPRLYCNCMAIDGEQRKALLLNIIIILVLV
jgi:hypothetical protein